VVVICVRAKERLGSMGMLWRYAQMVWCGWTDGGSMRERGG
jgi:hypothetical protein